MPERAGRPGLHLARAATLSLVSTVAFVTSCSAQNPDIERPKAPAAAPETNAVSPDVGPSSLDAPRTLALGQRISGTTVGGESSFNDCSEIDHYEGPHPEQVYRFTLPKRAHFEADLQPDVPSRGRLGLLNAEKKLIACDRLAMRQTLEAGPYFLIVDGLADRFGEGESDRIREYSLTTSVHPIPSVASVCGAVPKLSAAPGRQTVSGVLSPDLPSHFSTLFDAAKTQPATELGRRSAEGVHKLEVAQRSRLRVRTQGEGSMATYIRSECDDASTQIASETSPWAISTVVDPGNYFVYVDGGALSTYPLDSPIGGAYQLEVDLNPAEGGGAPGEVCGSVVDVSSGDFEIDTISARDDFEGSCGGSGSPDVVRRLKVGQLSKLRAMTQTPEMDARIYLRTDCDAPTSEIACSGERTGGTHGILEETLKPGTYYLIIDGKDANAFGRAQLHLSLEDISAADRACRQSPVLAIGKTKGALSEDRRVATYQLRLAKKQNVNLKVETGSEKTIIQTTLRKVSCVDEEYMRFTSDGTSKPDDALEAGLYFVTVKLLSPKSGDFTLTTTLTSP